jgi:hypothetical protein
VAIEAAMAEPNHWPNGRVIADLMVKQGFSKAEDLVRAIKQAFHQEISARTIQLIVKGETKHKESTLQLIADALNVSLGEIILIKDAGPDDPREAGGVEGSDKERKLEIECPPEQIGNVLEVLARLNGCGMNEIKVRIIRIQP